MATAHTHVPEAGQRVEQGFGTTALTTVGETSAVALAEREKATIQSFFVMALQRPRSVPRFEMALMKECERPGFAEVARYRKPVGKKKNDQTGEWVEQFAEGFSIRFAEAAMRHWGNTLCDAKIVYEDQEKRIVRFTCIDLESNIPLTSEIQLAKTVERKKLKQYQEAVGERTNSKGEKVYIVEATDDELNMKQASAWSKFIRNVLRFMPGDVLDAAEVQLEKTLKGQSGEAALEKLVLAFDRLGLKASDLQNYLGKSLSKITPDDMVDLRKVYTALKDSETTWDQLLEARNPTTTDKDLKKDVLLDKIRMFEQAGDHAAAERFAKDNNIAYPIGRSESGATTSTKADERGEKEAATDNPAAAATASSTVTTYADFPDAAELPPNSTIIVADKGKFTNGEECTGWTPVKEDPPADAPKQAGFAGFGKAKSK